MFSEIYQVMRDPPIRSSCRKQDLPHQSIAFRPEVTNRLSEKQKTCKDKIKTLEGNKEYLERSLKESENSLRELIVQKRQ